MKLACPECGVRRSEVHDTRRRKTYIKRRHHCLGCGHRYRTNEFIVPEGGQALGIPLTTLKRHSRDRPESVAATYRQNK